MGVVCCSFFAFCLNFISCAIHISGELSYTYAEAMHPSYFHIDSVSLYNVHHRIKRNASLVVLTSDVSTSPADNFSGLITDHSDDLITTEVLPTQSASNDSLLFTSTIDPTDSTLLVQPTLNTGNGSAAVREDEDHRYYSSYTVKWTSVENYTSYYWVSEETMYQAETHGTLSESYRSAVTVPLSFTFYFYGHEVRQVTIATGGFLYMSDFLHQWLTATQYVAPLMANFDTQLGNNSYIRYMDNGTAFVVWWEDAYLQDFHEAGPFSFQAMLHKDGRILFSYKQVPAATLLKIPTSRHPVKVGLSDAYYVDKPANSDSRQRTIYEYHRVEINMTQVASNSTVIITPLPTCVVKKTCKECIEATSFIPFQCQWCPAVGRCSDGLDRRRQEWQEKSCDKSFISTIGQCKYADSLYGKTARLSFKGVVPSSDAGIAGVVLVTFLIVLVMVLLAWIFYAYRNPNSQSGIWLIQHRPTRLLDRLRLLTLRRSSQAVNKYEVAMHPEAESLA